MAIASLTTDGPPSDLEVTSSASAAAISRGIAAGSTRAATRSLSSGIRVASR